MSGYHYFCANQVISFTACTEKKYLKVIDASFSGYNTISLQDIDLFSCMDICENNSCASIDYQPVVCSELTFLFVVKTHPKLTVLEITNIITLSKPSGKRDQCNHWDSVCFCFIMLVKLEKNMDLHQFFSRWVFV